MDAIRFGLAIRALRRRRGWTQSTLAARSGISQSAVSRIERGDGNRLTVALLTDVARVLGARVRVQLLADGENLDRLLDADHASIVEQVSELLARHGWEVVPEATFSVYGERGSIDILAFHPPSASLLMIEVKSVVPDVQATLAGIDRKARLAATVARQRGWNVRSVSRWLVVADTTSARSRIERHAATFAAALPARAVELRRWAAHPDKPIAGVMFVRVSTHVGRTHRIRPRKDEPGPSQHRRG
ncbi:MAG TPA: helix-turn-helix domain-containing protein [Candidatus Limnocylindrales bacterium]|nr:helix-turn-helix domain-containing protein [Candidatus Limnocylindrales bacterium]